eukprot:6180637-Pleurochrysis_carterae.AAC.3
MHFLASSGVSGLWAIGLAIKRCLEAALGAPRGRRGRALAGVSIQSAFDQHNCMQLAVDNLPFFAEHRSPWLA